MLTPVVDKPATNLNSRSQLERRLDRLEFELRKSLHEIGRQQPIVNDSAGSQAGAATGWASSLAARLELVEKFITITTTKVSLFRLLACDYSRAATPSQPASLMLHSYLGMMMVMKMMSSSSSSRQMRRKEVLVLSRVSLFSSRTAGLS